MRIRLPDLSPAQGILVTCNLRFVQFDMKSYPRLETYVDGCFVLINMTGYLAFVTPFKRRNDLPRECGAFRTNSLLQILTAEPALSALEQPNGISGPAET